jgi:Type II secretory pathway, component ExeA (predicted ATPase)
MGQLELLPRISGIKNLWDRISLKYVINPLEENEVREMINFRLEEAGYVSRYPLFTDNSIRAIFNYTQGYPRKISMICHDALEYLVMHKKEVIDKDIIAELIRKDVQPVDA